MTAEQAWAKTVGRMRAQLHPGNIDLYIAPLQLVGVEDECLVVEVDDRVRGWVDRRYAPRLADAIREVSDFKGLILQ